MKKQIVLLALLTFFSTHTGLGWFQTLATELGTFSKKSATTLIATYFTLAGISALFNTRTDKDLPKQYSKLHLFCGYFIQNVTLGFIRPKVLENKIDSLQKQVEYMHQWNEESRNVFQNIITHQLLSYDEWYTCLQDLGPFSPLLNFFIAHLKDFHYLTYEKIRDNARVAKKTATT